MSQHRLQNDLEQAHFESTGKLFYNISASGRMYGWGPTADLPSAVAGWTPGAIWIDTTTGTIYTNTGSATSCTFTEIIGSANDYLPLAGGELTGPITGAQAATLGALIASTLATSGAITAAECITITKNAAAAVAALRLGKTATEGLEVKVIDETIDLTNAVSSPLTAGTIPTGAVILSVQANLEKTVVGDASGDDGLVKVAVGISGAVDKYGKTADLVKNSKIDTIPDWAVNAGETIRVYAVDASGAAVTEKFVADTAAVRVRIVYAVNNSLDDAA